MKYLSYAIIFIITALVSTGAYLVVHVSTIDEYSNVKIVRRVSSRAVDTWNGTSFWRQNFLALLDTTCALKDNKQPLLFYACERQEWVNKSQAQE